MGCFTLGKQCPFVQKGLRLLVGIPQSPENCPADRLRARESGTFYDRRFTANKKEGRQQPHDCHLPIDRRCFLILFSPVLVPAPHRSSGTGRCPVLRSDSSSFLSSQRGTPHRVFSYPQGCFHTRMTDPLHVGVS